MPPPVRSPEQVFRRLGEGRPSARDPGPDRSRSHAGLLLHLRAGDGEGHGVAPAGIEVGRHLERGRRRLAPHARDTHPIGCLLGQGNGVEACDGIGAEVARTADFVEQLRGDRADGDRAPGAGVLGDDGGAVGLHLGDGKPDALGVWDLFEEGVVAAAALGAALDDMAGDDRAGDGVEIVVPPAERVQRRTDHQRGVGDPTRDDHLGPGGQRVGNGTGWQVGVGGDDGRAGGKLLTGVEVDEALPSLLQLAQARRDVVARDGGDRYIDALAFGQLPHGVGQRLGMEPPGIGDHCDAALDAGR